MASRTCWPQSYSSKGLNSANELEGEPRASGELAALTSPFTVALCHHEQQSPNSGTTDTVRL